MSDYRPPYPTLLRTPDLAPDVDPDVMSTWPAGHVLPLAPAQYEIEAGDQLWRVRVRGTDDLVYVGPGPVDLIESPAPF